MSVSTRRGSATVGIVAIVGIAALGSGACGADSVDTRRNAVVAGQLPLATATLLASNDERLASRLRAQPEAEGFVPDASAAGGFTSSGWRGAAERRWNDLGARIPRRADGTIEIGVSRFAATRLRLKPRASAGAGEGRTESGHVIYDGAYGGNVDVVVTTSRSSVEELFVLRNADAPTTLQWDVELPTGITRVSTRSDGSLAFQDKRGETVISVPRAYAVDALGTHRDAELAWDAPARSLSVHLDTRGLAFPVLLDPAFEVAAWQPGPGTPPTLRAYHAMAYDEARGNIVLFGGWSGISFLNDTWTYDGVTWTEQAPATVPPVRGEAAMTYDGANGEVVMFGGNIGGAGVGANLDDTWVWNGTDWTNRAPANAPSPRSYVSMVYDAARNNVVLFGGSVPGVTHLNDTWIWSGLDWTKLAPATSPTARSAYAMAYDPNTSRVILFGGNDNASFKNQTYSWNGTTWALLAPPAAPTARSYHSMAYDPSRKAIVMFGGGTANAVSASNDDTWTFNGTTWAQLPGATKPSKRRFHKMAYDAARKRVVVMGGLSSANVHLADAWVYHSSGGACADGNDCATGLCIDGVCCESTCGTCEACDLAAGPGVCNPVKNATDPDSCTGTMECDGAGQCKVSGAQACTLGSECGSGNCIDGVCCDTACNGQCEACDVPGKKGTCSAVTGAPRGTRTACPSGGASAPCATATCDGIVRTACKDFAKATTSCRTASCKDGVATSPASCDGAGGCPAIVTKACAPYACGGDACKDGCTSDSDCAAGSSCQNAKCGPKVAIGAGCSDRRTLSAADGKKTDCAPFRCDAQACLTSCASSNDCIAPATCESGKCALPSAPTPSPNDVAASDDGGCSVSVTRRASPFGAAALVGVGALLVAARRTRRRRLSAHA